MNESILTSIKKLLGITEEYEYFDLDIIIHINSIFAKLNQLGVGPKTPFKITGKIETWDMFTKTWETNEDRIDIDYVKTYVYLKVRLVKAMVFPVVMYGCESWTVKKAER